MIPELGHLALILALCLAVLQGIIPLWGAQRGDALWMGLGRSLCWGQFLMMLVAFASLTLAFVTDDFSVAYVANNSNSLLPLPYKFSAVWGAHEGSLLLWALMLSGWSFAVSLCSRNLPPEMLARILAVIAWISCGFLLFMLLTSNPFTRLLPNMPADGSDLNPLLQDFGLIVHPPMLYMGYVGFSVAFASAIAALIGGRLDAAWARWSRPWTMIAWAFLTLGIALGSWWAYYELGWGGWWFWDPVENASLMPWLVGTALMHSLAVTEKRGVLKSWTVLLAIFAFSLSLLGTFLVRSGVLTSVHAFATDPARGTFILAFLLLVVGGSLTLYALRAPVVKSQVGLGLLSRELFLLLNNLLLVVAAAMILLATLYPLLIDALGMGKISVGPPYFNAMFVPLTWLLLVTFALGVRAHWKSSPLSYLRQQLLRVLPVAVIVGTALQFVQGGDYRFSVLISLILVAWVVLVIGLDVAQRLQGRGLFGLLRLKPAYLGMQLAHFGVAIAVVGAAMTSAYTEERSLRMAPGEGHLLAGYEFEFTGVEHREGPNYSSDYGTLVVRRDGRELTTLHPEKRFYVVQRMSMSEAGIDPGLTRDLYVALGEDLGDGAWAVRLQVKPFVRWLWLGALLMALGGFIAVCDRRYRLGDARGRATPAHQSVEGVC